MNDRDHFVCAYHGQPIGQFALAHIFPAAIGGVTSTRQTVCRDCNNRVNSRVENPALAFFALYRSIWGIGGRNDKIPPVRAEARFVDGRSAPVQLGPDGEVRHPIFIDEVRPGGRRSRLVIASPERLEEHRSKMASADPSRPLGDTFEYSARVLVNFDGDSDKPILRRLAAKVAFERAAMLRNGEFVSGLPFESIRKFILQGTDPGTLCGSIGDEAVYRDSGPLSFNLGDHAVIVTTQRDIFGAVVILFGLFYYWVALARPYKVIAQWDDILVEDPQKGTAENPTLRLGTGALQLPWDSWITASVNRPDDVRQRVSKLALERLERGLAAFYDKRVG